MKGKFWIKALAAALALLVVSGNVPIRSVADLFGVAAITASAEELETSGQCGDNAYWVLDSGKLTISGTGDMYDYEYYTVPWDGFKDDDITSVVIENGITSIGNSAFEDCAVLRSITIPDSVTSIGDRAFSNCTSLTSVKMSKNVTSIGNLVFADCTSLESITIPEKVTSIGDYAFDCCTSLTSVTIPDSVKSIGGYAFRSCESLTSITIPDSVTSIGREAFYYCTNITDVYCYADPDKLTWDEDGCDDFIRPQNSKMTICHVPKKYLETYEDNFGGVNVRFVGDLVDMGLGEHLYGHSITLDGSIGVNFYVELTDELLASDTAEMVFTVPNGSKTDTQTLLVKDVIADDSNKVVIGGKTYYVFKCNVSAKDMASEITAQIVDGETKGQEYTYSVRDYAKYILDNSDDYSEKTVSLVKAMLNYGSAAQEYFFGDGEDDENLANFGLNTDYGAVEWVGAENLSKPFEASDPAFLPSGVTFVGSTLSLKSETTLSLYLKSDNEIQYVCNEDVEVEKTDDYWIFRIRGISASKLDRDITLDLEVPALNDGGTVTYCPLTYCYNVLNGGSDDAKLKKACQALFLYSQAAKEYSGREDG